MKKNDNLIIWILVGGIVLFAALSVYNHYQIFGTKGPSTSPKVGANSVSKGKPAPQIVLQDLQGRTVQLSDYNGKVVVLNFWASWCPPCKDEMPDLNQLAAELDPNQAVLLAVDLTDGSRETEAKARQYISDNRFSMRVLLDKGGKTADAYSITSIPTTFIIDKQGRISDYIKGSTTKETIRAYVNKLQ